MHDSPLYKWRKYTGNTQSDVARVVGVSLTAYQLWERGLTSPSPYNAEQLAVVVGIDTVRAQAAWRESLATASAR